MSKIVTGDIAISSNRQATLGTPHQGPLLGVFRNSRSDSEKEPLRLDNTGAWVIEVYPSLLCNRMSENADLYIK